MVGNQGESAGESEGNQRGIRGNQCHILICDLPHSHQDNQDGAFRDQFSIFKPLIL